MGDLDGRNVIVFAIAIAIISTLAAAPLTPYPLGLVPSELLESLGEPYRPSSAPLSLVAHCAAVAPGERDDACSTELGVIGQHADGRIALLEAPRVDGCGNFETNSDTRLRVAKNSVKGGKATRLADGNGTWVPSIGQAWTHIGALVKAGFVAPIDLRAQIGSQVSGIRGHEPLAVLAAPLAGWMVYGREEAGDVVVRLVAPDNKTSHVIHKRPVGGCSASSEEDQCNLATDPSIRQVVLTPDAKHLVVTYSVSDGSHCGSDPAYFARWALPEGALR